MSNPPTDSTADSLAQYSRSLHAYTLGLWTESRRQADQGTQDAAPPVRTTAQKPEDAPTQLESVAQTEAMSSSPADQNK
ncbi:hypothetical protein HYPSUDRAFT_34086 [Hypholoma sublateritium FD-334 SS-4]|uniref:Uncharacterized protein n=1 Tax=Hypholoma sublateritium (strain FD-334 SS-4) TaxID=945553 RepID=A0A0D2PJR8_HYPSF|nr:hypothetical protein HYPSUDRAFT_34086 [Hypholoma sublateritium FD-334 SS-4]